MKVLCIRQIYPENDFGSGPNDFLFCFTENHSYYAALLNDWEEGSKVKSDDYEVNDNTYRYCLDEVIKYISGENTKKADEYDEYAVQAGWLDISEEEFAKCKLVKASALMNFVVDKVDDCFDVHDNEKMRDCLSYLVYDFDSCAKFDEYNDEEKDELKARIQEYQNEGTTSVEAATEFSVKTEDSACISQEKINKSVSTNIDMKNAKVGDTILFGSYKQAKNATKGKEDIEWIILDKQEDKILVISKYALDCKPYNTTDSDVIWETCSLREWLNGKFYNETFSKEEKAKIMKATVSADKNPEYDTDPGKATNDNVFLLSITEVNKYFDNNEERKCAPSAYAKAQGASTISYYRKGGKATCNWWLRSPGHYQSNAVYVSRDGSVDINGADVDGGSIDIGGFIIRLGDYGVRPALWINLES